MVDCRGCCFDAFIHVVGISLAFFGDCEEGLGDEEAEVVESQLQHDFCPLAFPGVGGTLFVDEFGLVEGVAVFMEVAWEGLAPFAKALV